jgi:hypothetical protein
VVSASMPSEATGIWALCAATLHDCRSGTATNACIARSRKSGECAGDVRMSFVITADVATTIMLSGRISTLPLSAPFRRYLPVRELAEKGYALLGPLGTLSLADPAACAQPIVTRSAAQTARKSACCEVIVSLGCLTP